ncbi:ABC transporter substrate-binding protein [Paenibacillus sp. SYP-B3998]|uniref:ABC transporter substrate-binding protein n=1 Tax=Paenibacillus sp. SYP-B3998 TaxID=2678564 RepID=UPI0031F874D4
MITFTFILVMTVVVGLSGCSSPFSQRSVVDNQTATEPQGDAQNDSDQVELTMWSYYDGWEPLIRKFTNKYHGVKVKVETFTYSTYKDKYLQSLIDGHPPDIFVIDSNQFGEFNAIEGLENLLAKPYEAGGYQDDFSPYLWESNKSFDQKQLIGFPYASSPSVTYYRADLLQQYGFPSDPEELGHFMEKPENWIEMAKVLKEHDIWISLWPTDVLELYEHSKGLYDSDFNYQRNDYRFGELFNTSKKISELGLDANVDIWQEGGKKLVRDNKLAMLYMGTWGLQKLQTWFPEQAGKWRETKLPFQLYGWQNSSNFSLSSLSKHKNLAWKFIEFAVTQSSMDGIDATLPAYLPARNKVKQIPIPNEFLGGQTTNALHVELASKMIEHVVTPIDQEANAMWEGIMNKGIENDDSISQVQEAAMKELNGRFGRDIEILLKGR